MQKHVSTILKLCWRFSTTQRKRQRQCRGNRLDVAGLICKPCCGWFARIIAANMTKYPGNALVWIVAALSYLIDPFDLIPDATPRPRLR